MGSTFVYNIAQLLLLLNTVISPGTGICDNLHNTKSSNPYYSEHVHASFHEDRNLGCVTIQVMG